MATQQPKRLGEVLIDAGIVTDRQLGEALARKRGTNQRLGSMLVSMGLATEAQICRAVAAQQGIEVMDLRTALPEAAAVKLLQPELAQKHCMIPLRCQAGRLVLVMADPMDMEGFDAAWRAARCATVERVMAPESEVAALVQEHYGTATGTQDALRGLPALHEVAILSPERGPHADSGVADFNANDAINAILGGAAEMGATHVRIEPSGRTTNIRYRIDGKLRRAVTLPAGVHSSILGILRTLFHVDQNQPSGQQEGTASLQLGANQVGLRLFLIPSVGGDAAVVRILDQRRAQMHVEQLGFAENHLATVSDILSLPNGLVLVAGPEDSGTSTTLAAFLNHVGEETTSLVSIENPVEALLPGVTQIEVNERAGVSWVEAVRGALRLEPDVVMISDLLDPATASLALRAAMTGRLVLAGVHTDTAAAAIALLLDMGLEPYLLALTLRGAIGQRLVRRVCPECRVPQQPDARSLGWLEVTPEELEGKQFWHGQGCSRCAATGFAGRVGIFEVARVTGAVRERIAARASALEITRAAMESGMQTLREDALTKVFAGLTTLPEAARVVPCCG